MASRPNNPDKSSAILDLHEVISKGHQGNRSPNNPIKDVLNQLEIKISNLPEDKAVLILNEVIRLIDNMTEPAEQKSDDMATLFSQNIQSSVEAVITKELEDWIRHRLPQVFSETVSAQLNQPKTKSNVTKSSKKDSS
jgi:hypothetical protein